MFEKGCEVPFTPPGGTVATTLQHCCRMLGQTCVGRPHKSVVGGIWQGWQIQHPGPLGSAPGQGFLGGLHHHWTFGKPTAHLFHEDCRCDALGEHQYFGLPGLTGRGYSAPV